MEIITPTLVTTTEIPGPLVPMVPTDMAAWAEKEGKEAAVAQETITATATLGMATVMALGIMAQRAETAMAIGEALGI